MKFVLSYLSPYKGRMAVGFLFKVVGTVAELVLPLIMSYMIDDVVPTGNVLALSLWGGGMLLAAVAALLGNVKANRMASKVARDTMERIRSDLFCKTLSLSARQVDEVTLPSLVSRLSSDTYNVHNMIGMAQRLGVRAPILLVGGIALTFMVDAMLALVLLASVPVIALIVFLVTRRGVGLYTQLQRSADSMVRKVRDDYTGIRVIKALSKGGYESASFRAVNEQVSRNETKASVTMGIANPLLNAVLNLGMAAVVFVGAYRVAGGNAMPGDIIAFTSYFSIILNAVISVSRIFVMLTRGGASAKRIGAILDLPAELVPMPDLPAGEAEGDGADVIRFEHVSFSYGGAPALEDIHFTIRKGQSLGVIGATGSGKSTLVALLLRLYDPSAGQVIIDGRNSTTAQLAAGYLSIIAGNVSGAGTVFESIQYLYNPNNLTQWFILPALIMMLSMLQIMVLSALSVAREREMGTFEQLLVTPFTTGELLASKAVVPILIGIFQGTLIFLISVFWFEVPLMGSILKIYAVMAVFVLAVVGLGLAISAYSKTMQQGLLIAFVTLVPMVLLSGLFTPVDNMPAWVQAITWADPLRFALLSVRRIYLADASWLHIAQTMIPTAAVAAVTLPFAYHYFKKRL